eukprot:TRINITY_DN3098_c0_g1_i1.p1 TRINITY_DN3098_c0_g1~~TRINITY_DN3098_c0_g1_i1.p1  ORF type:complete len:449 (-),score=60.47 TRINITY_DN3098_c0_g1_i1:28-1374(-)
MEEHGVKRARTLTNSNHVITRTASYFVTVSPGLEFLAEEEIREKLNPSILKRTDRSGKVFFATDRPVEVILKLRSAENVFAFVAETQGVPSDESGLDYLQNLPSTVDWEPALHVWKSSPLIWQHHQLLKQQQVQPASSYSETAMDQSSGAQPHVEPSSSSRMHTRPRGASTATFPFVNTVILEKRKERDESTSSSNELEPVFRVTGRRTGYQTYKSPQMAGRIGAGIISRYGWKVDLKQYNMEVFADLCGDLIVMGINLSPAPLYTYRYHSTSSLPPSIAYCMARLARIQTGHIVMDPIMGPGTIPIEASLEWPHAFFIGGDIAKEAVGKALANRSTQASVRFDLFEWNVTKIPFVSKAVDIIVSNIPFGKNRVGVYKHHPKLFPLFIREITRVTKLNGRAVLLTESVDLMKKVLVDNLYWNEIMFYAVEIGGSEVGLFLLQRTDIAF